MRPLNIMVVDDSLISVRKLTQMLSEMGHSVVHSAPTGVAAVASYPTIRPDLVTMDINMPDMDGIEATRQILAVDQGALIVVVTSHGQQQMVLDAINAGAKGYVLKPIREDKLKDVIQTVADRYLPV